MADISYCIVCKDRSGGETLWLGGVEDNAGVYWCDVEAGVPEPGQPEFWAITPIKGTDAYYLLNQNADLYACFTPDSQVIALRPLDIFDPGFIIKLDDVGDGFVAINNSARDNVFTTQYHPSPGAPVTRAPWQGSDAQIWKFVESGMV
jgi:hypothetical protein